MDASIRKGDNQIKYTYRFEDLRLQAGLIVDLFLYLVPDVLRVILSLEKLSKSELDTSVHGLGALMLLTNLSGLASGHVRLGSVLSNCGYRVPCR